MKRFQGKLSYRYLIRNEVRLLIDQMDLLLTMEVSMGYVERPYVKVGTGVLFEIRKKTIEACVTKMPFVPTNYYIPKAAK